MKKEEVKDIKLSPEKIVYKNEKRRTRNRLIYLVCLHLLYIFVFVGLMCVEYLVPRNWSDSF